ncbi:MAG: hypothetical protein M1820_000079 [Bogoriella megaspora]|nr:MAG: hypothetical protein M1820_000079 [Bogoriella megaspora]
MDTMHSSISFTERLLSLPVELRHEIFSYALPHSQLLRPRRESHQESIVWYRKSLSPLLVSRALLSSCLDYIYSTSMFTIHVTYDAIKFHQPWLNSRGLLPSNDFVFPECFSSANRKRIRKYSITIKQPDDYTGMIKYNCQGPGLIVRMKEQVRKLVVVMNESEILDVVVINNERVWDGKRTGDGEVQRIVRASQVALEPFLKLEHRVSQVKVIGAVDIDFAKQLRQEMAKAKT